MENVKFQNKGGPTSPFPKTHGRFAANKTYFFDSCGNVDHFICGVKMVKRFVNAYLHCIVSNVKWIRKMATWPPLEKFLRTRMAT